MRRRRCPRLSPAIAGLLVAALGGGTGLGAQEAPRAVPDSVVRQAPVSPGGAFLRAMLIPGWGHSALGSYKRGGFYFAVEGITAYGILRTQRRISEVRSRLRFREDLLVAELAVQGITSPEEVEAALESDETVSDLRGLLGSRREQREDLVAFGIFLMLLSGVDAYVTGHLADFPAPLELEGAPLGDGRVELALRVSLPR